MAGHEDRPSMMLVFFVVYGALERPAHLSFSPCRQPPLFLSWPVTATPLHFPEHNIYLLVFLSRQATAHTVFSQPAASPHKLFSRPATNHSALFSQRERRKGLGLGEGEGAFLPRSLASPSPKTDQKSDQMVLVLLFGLTFSSCAPSKVIPAEFSHRFGLTFPSFALSKVRPAKSLSSIRSDFSLLYSLQSQT